ncbi:hypothetical protein [Peribacillus butanolivorans]
MHAFVGKLNGSIEKINKFFRVSIQLPNPSLKQYESVQYSVQY